jgi:hypothetical protein
VRDTVVIRVVRSVDLIAMTTAPWLSWLKRLPSKQEIAGSNPTGA